MRRWLSLALVWLLVPLAAAAQTSTAGVRINGVTTWPSARVLNNFDLALTGVRLTGSNGSLTVLGRGDGQDEDLTLDFNATANTIGFSSSTGVTTWTWTGLTTIDFGSNGVRLSQDADGAITFAGLGNGSDEDLTINLDDTANTIVLSSSTGVTAIGLTDNTIDFGATGAVRPRALFLAQPSVTVGSGTGVTVDDTGSVRDVVYKVTVTFSNVTTNGTTHDLTLATLPAKTFIQHILADVTTPYVCADTCTTATLSGTVGSAAGGTGYLLSFDLDAAAAQFGDAAAELGSSLNPSTMPTSLGALGAWASTIPVSFRITSAVGDLATLGVTNLNAGAITFYITTIKMP